MSTQSEEPDPLPRDAVAPLDAENEAQAEPESGADGPEDGRQEVSDEAALIAALKRLDEAEERLKRALADMDNLRKRHARELEQERAAERARTAAALLPVVDNLELALAHAQSDPDKIVEGVRAVRDQAVDILHRLGYPRHAEAHVPFDPARHEVMGVIEDPDAEPGTVVRVLRPGYGEPDHQLRPTAVAVAKRE